MAIETFDNIQIRDAVSEVQNKIASQLSLPLCDVEIMVGKYASYGSGNVVILADVADTAAIKINTTKMVGKALLLSAVEKNATYNLFCLFANDGIKVGQVKDSGVTEYKDRIVVISDIYDTLYVNCLVTDGPQVSITSVTDINPPLCSIFGIYGSPISYDPIESKITISNTSVSNDKVGCVVTMQNSFSIFAPTSVTYNQVIENAVSGVLYYDRDSNEFSFASNYVVPNPTPRRMLVAVFYESKVIYGNENIRTQANHQKHAGKKLYCFGDSLTWYDGKAATWGPDQGETIRGFESYLRKYVALSVFNLGVSGETTPQIMARLRSSTDVRSTNCKMISIMSGDNDDRLGVSVGELLPAGSTFDTTTVIGALQSGIETVLSYNPGVQIFMMTEPIGWRYDSSQSKLVRVDEKYPNALRTVAAYYGIPLLDLWKISGVNELTRDTMYLDPPASENTMYMYHPSNIGWRSISEKIVQFVQSL